MPAHVPPVADERSGLLGFLAQQRNAARTAAYGLTDAEARLTPSASALSVGGLIKHLTRCERNWMDTVLQRADWSEADAYQAYLAGFVCAESDSIADVLAEYDAACLDSDAVIAGIADLDQPVPVPDRPWFPDGVDNWSVRWVLLHLIEETARHAGHLDVIRESIDGASSGALLAAAEDWAPGPFVVRWSKKEEASVGAV